MRMNVQLVQPSPCHSLVFKGFFVCFVFLFFKVLFFRFQTVISAQPATELKWIKNFEHKNAVETHSPGDTFLLLPRRKMWLQNLGEQDKSSCRKIVSLLSSASSVVPRRCSQKTQTNTCSSSPSKSNKKIYLWKESRQSLETEANSTTIHFSNI